MVRAVSFIILLCMALPAVALAAAGRADARVPSHDTAPAIHGVLTAFSIAGAQELTAPLVQPPLLACALPDGERDNHACRGKPMLPGTLFWPPHPAGVIGAAPVPAFATRSALIPIDLRPPRDG